MKILILKPSSLGDVVQTLPVLRLLKLHWPASEIYWWIDSTFASLLEGDPDLAGVVLFERRRWASPRHWPEAVRSVRWMREQRFDLVIDLQCLARSAAFAWLANGDLLVGLDEVREGARAFYDVIARRATYHTHAVDWYMETLKLIGVPVHWNFCWLPERAAAASEIRRKWNPDSKRWVMLQPGARWENKRWPVENFAELVRRLAASDPDLRFAVLGSAADQSMGAVISREEPQRCLDLTGKISLSEMIEWIRLSSLMVTNDTGPMHVAAALGTPVVGLFGPTEPRRTGPYGQLGNVLQTDLPCVPCMKSVCTWPKPIECLRDITVQRAFVRIQNQLKQPKQT